MALIAGESHSDRGAFIGRIPQRDIACAISIPHRTMSQETTKHVDRKALMVIYRDGIGCNPSTKGALNKAKLGFRVKELTEGLDWSKHDGHKMQSDGDC